jgi:hypothetical protein
MVIQKCSACGKQLAEPEKERYFKELEAWMQAHPDWMTYIDHRDIHNPRETGIHSDCDPCAVKRLQFEKEMRNRETFLTRAAQGGPEGFWLVAVVILLMVVFIMASGR